MNCKCIHFATYNFYACVHVCISVLLTHSYSPTSTSGGHTASVQPASSIVPHQAAASGEEYALTTKVVTTKPQQQQTTEEYAVMDKNKKHATAAQGVSYISSHIMYINTITSVLSNFSSPLFWLVKPGTCWPKAPDFTCYVCNMCMCLFIHIYTVQRQALVGQNFGRYVTTRKLLDKILAADHTNNSSLFELTTFDG